MNERKIMSKRFHETEIWEEDWFISLPKDYRYLWLYIKDRCDHAGIWKPNLSLFNKLFDCEVNIETAIELFNKDKERVIKLRNGRLFLVQFIPFQYGRVLNLKNRLHSSIYQLLMFNEVNLTSIRPQIEVKDTLKDKDKEKEINTSFKKINKKIFKEKDINTYAENEKLFSAKEENFEKFWKIYPARNGKKLLKDDAKKFFIEKIKDEDFSLLMKAVENYAISKTVTDGFAKDAIRFLKKDFWRSWIEPETPTRQIRQIPKTASNWELLKKRQEEGVYDREG